ncbi:MAG: SRPBCC domain-containing protein [Nitrospiria bacterium]
MLWKAPTSSNFSRLSWMGSRIECDWKAESPIKFINPKEEVVVQGKALVVDKPKWFSYTRIPRTNEVISTDAPVRVTFQFEPSLRGTRLTYETRAL